MTLLKRIILYLIHKWGYQLVKFEKPPDFSAHETHTIITNISEIKKVHYGCSFNYLKGWLNIDLNAPHKEGFFVASVDLTKRHPFPEERFEFGFAEDFIEHLGQADQIIFLYEVYRTFKRNGVLRLSFPGLEGMLKKHYERLDYPAVVRARYDAYEKWGHLHFPCVGELDLICKHIGFRGMNIVEFGSSVYDELKMLDTRNDQIGENSYVEIVK